MKRSPDLILVVVLFFIVGTVMTGVSQSAPEIASLVQQVFNS
ncbi:hypothetical protein D791_02600 [Nitrincola nitratireducens]|jgi:hypothetical protein|uniref:Uncharacterized protein n=1 Tax=Nitrincola nitratireducens TaxID=1229521 RepID=W9VIX7_9GAMM|nr:hypothetical protein D791_02600 [Nitrincola nitratireducens]